MKPIKFKSQGKEYNIVFFKEIYVDSRRICIKCMYNDKRFGLYLPFCDITADIIPTEDTIDNIPFNYGFLNTKNGNPDLINVMHDEGWLQDTNVIITCDSHNYPLVEFTDKFLNMID